MIYENDTKHDLAIYIAFMVIFLCTKVQEELKTVKFGNLNIFVKCGTAIEDFVGVGRHMCKHLRNTFL